MRMAVGRSRRRTSARFIEPFDSEGRHYFLGGKSSSFNPPVEKPLALLFREMGNLFLEGFRGYSFTIAYITISFSAELLKVTLLLRARQRNHTPTSVQSNW